MNYPPPWRESEIDSSRTFELRVAQVWATPWEQHDVILVTGGAGFIGTNFVRQWLDVENERVLVTDNLGHAGSQANLDGHQARPLFSFEHADVCERGRMEDILKRSRPRAVVHFAAETHVDRSIAQPCDFVRANVDGTFSLLEATLAYWRSLGKSESEAFRFLYLSTDEVYGSLDSSDPPCRESATFAPNSPYAATKAAADHLVRAYHRTYGLPTLTIRCSNNYGPYQYPEKFTPLAILAAISRKPIPVYGDGRNIRDWIYVDDHCSAVRLVLSRGTVGGVYNVGGGNELSNLEVARSVCEVLDNLMPSDGPSRASLIVFVRDRPGHDQRYAVDTGLLSRELGWRPKESYASGLRRTIDWYLSNPAWIDRVQDARFSAWIRSNYDERVTTEQRVT